MWTIVMSREQNSRESSVNVISRFFICVKHELSEWRFSLFVMILSEKLPNILRDFTWNYRNCALMEFHHFELKWNAIPWNSEKCFWAWIFRENEFTDPSLVNTSESSTVCTKWKPHWRCHHFHSEKQFSHETHCNA